jgi:hypothetical protein
MCTRASERQAAMYETERTGVRFVLSSPSDPDRVDDYHAWYDTYGTIVTRLVTS